MGNFEICLNAGPHDGKFRNATPSNVSSNFKKTFCTAPGNGGNVGFYICT